MKKERLERANKITNTIKALKDLACIMGYPYPQFLCSDIDVNSATYDAETLDGLKKRY